MSNIKESRLKETLISNRSCYENARIALSKFMRNIPHGTEREAMLLNRFIEIWGDEFRFKDPSEREKREAQIRCGITEYIESHFYHLYIQSKPFCPSSMNLLQCGLYGPKRKYKNDYLNDLIVRDSIDLYKDGKVVSQNTTAEKMKLDRKTIREARKTSEHQEQVPLINEVLSKIKLIDQ